MVSAIILAAGMSKRMRLGNKLMLEKNNIPIIIHTIKNVFKSNVSEIIVVLGNESKIMNKILKTLDVKIIYNNMYKTGISSSIKKGLDNIDANCKGVLICLGDMPMIKTSTYNKIIDAFYNNQKKNIIPFFNNKRGNPVLFDKSYFNKIKNIEGDQGAKYLINQDPKKFFKVKVYDEGLINDIDTAMQYKEYIKE